MVFLLALNSCLLISTIFILLKKELKQKPSSSEMLGRMLNDMRSHGYGLMRIEPDSVFYRSPKD